MSEFKGTKGEWKVFNTGDESITIVNEDKSQAIAFLPELFADTQANAKLIARAPEMLNMLKNLLSLYINTDKPSVRITLEAQELINKATQ